MLFRAGALVSAIAWLGGSSVAVAAPTWKEIGPNPISGGDSGRVTDIAAHPSDPDVLFVATASGGAWRYDKGQWTAMTDDLSMLATGSIAVDPKDPNNIYLGGGESNFAPHCFYGTGIFKSADGGKSWKNVGAKVSAGRAVSSIVISQQDSKVIYASVQRAGGAKTPDAARHHPGMKSPMGVYRSEDGGETWAHLAGLPKGIGATDVVISPADDAVVYAALGDRKQGSEHGVYRSKDSGKTWKKLELSGAGSNIGRVVLAVSKSEPDAVFALVAAGTPPDNPRKAKVLGLWKSSDGGESFRKSSPGQIAAGFGWFMLVAGVNPKDPKEVAVGALNLVRSGDGGSRFSDISPPHPDVHAVTWDAKGRMIVGDDGGVHRSSSNGRSWESLNKGFGSIQFYPALALHPTNPKWILGGLQDNGTVLWNGSTWRRVFGGDGGYAALHPDNPDVVLGQSQHTGNLMRSTNGGRSFSRSSSGINKDDRDAFFNPVIFDPNDKNVAYYATQRLYRSENQGKSWQAISKDLTDGAYNSAIRSIDVAKGEGGILYVVTTDGRVMVSQDGGKTFEISLQDISDWKRVTRDIVISSRDPDVAYLGIPRYGSGIGRVVKTEDRGKTWVDISGNLPDIPVSSVDHYADPDSDGEGDILFIGTDNHAYISCDDGKKWTAIGKGKANALAVEIRYQPQFERVVVGTMGRGVWLMESATPEALREICETGSGEGPGEDGSQGPDSGSSPGPDSGKSKGPSSDGSNKSPDGETGGSPKDSQDPNDPESGEPGATPDASSGSKDSNGGDASQSGSGSGGGCALDDSQLAWGWLVLFLLGGARTRRRLGPLS